MADVFDVVFHHDEAVDAAAEREARVDVRIDAGGFHDIWMNHAAAQKFDLFAVRANAATVFTKWTFKRKFKAWLGKWKVKRVYPNVQLAAIVFF